MHSSHFPLVSIADIYFILLIDVLLESEQKETSENEVKVITFEKHAG